MKATNKILRQIRKDVSQKTKNPKVVDLVAYDSTETMIELKIKIREVEKNDRKDKTDVAEEQGLHTGGTVEAKQDNHQEADTEPEW